MRLPKSCLFPSCQTPTVKRSLCLKHYFQAYRAIKRGLATWDELIAQKKAAPSQLLGSPDKDWFVTKPEEPKAPETEAPQA